MNITGPDLKIGYSCFTNFKCFMYYYKNEKMMEYKQLLDEINWIDIERILYSIQKTLEGRQFINTYITAIIIPLFLFIISLEFSACGGKISELIYFASCTTLVLVILSLTYIRLLDCRIRYYNFFKNYFEEYKENI
ncbi:MAG: hypothetical protein KH183_08750 [Clostridium sp.]|nr:hypothetical protein [Clostridium sp.]